MRAARGRVWKSGRTWRYEVRIGNRLIFEDNTGSWAPILRDALFDVAVANRVVGAGHTFEKTYDRLVEEVRG